MEAWSRAALLAALLVCCGCAEGAKFIQETETGGVVAYPFKETGHMVSPFRKEALQMIEKRCAGSYRIVREGETKGLRRISGIIEGAQEVVTLRQWAIQFQCK